MIACSLLIIMLSFSALSCMYTKFFKTLLQDLMTDNVLGLELQKLCDTFTIYSPILCTKTFFSIIFALNDLLESVISQNALVLH